MAEIDQKGKSAMNDRKIIEKKLKDFTENLYREEKSEGTIEKYLCDLRQFAEWMRGKPITKNCIIIWREEMLLRGYKPATVNGKIAALNKAFAFWGWNDLKVKALKVQRQLFREQSRELTREEYERLVRTAQNLKKERLALVIETMCATGIRVSELRYITREAVENGRTEIRMKGKIRTILISGKLCRKLSRYAQKQKITAGEIFITAKGSSLSRKQIWAEMKKLCEAANVEDSKVFPHNLRHLFARCFYRVCRDIVRLADVLGHTNVETTRLYLISTGIMHEKTLEQLHLIL